MKMAPTFDVLKARKGLQCFDVLEILIESRSGKIGCLSKNTYIQFFNTFLINGHRLPTEILIEMLLNLKRKPYIQSFYLLR